MSFSQADYMPSDWTPSEASLADTGYAYVPTNCQSASSSVKCKLHFAYHGCQQTTADIGDDYYAEGGFNEWAEANDIIVIYPQAIKSDFDPSNAEGCFDWWGFTNSDYAVQDGPQMAYVANLLKSLPKDD
jgi:poly(3-hydroxybutyrate) depolymerase